MRVLRIALPVFSLILAACSKQSEPAQMKTAFKGDAPPAARAMADEAVAAFERKEYPKAVGNLQTLRTESGLSGDQLTAVQDMMARVQSELAARAEQGDKDAQETLRFLQMMPRR